MNAASVRTDAGELWTIRFVILWRPVAYFVLDGRLAVTGVGVIAQELRAVLGSGLQFSKEVSQRHGIVLGFPQNNGAECVSLRFVFSRVFQ